MKQLTRSLAACAASLLLLGAVAHAQATLSLDGRTKIDALMGSTVQVTITGTPGESAALFADISAGPSTVLGQSVPLGFTPALIVIPLGNVPPSGTLSYSLGVAVSPVLHNLTVYFLAVVENPATPMGVDFSNGAELTAKDRNIELAGNSLSQYPFFEYVRAFNKGSDVEMAIDPELFSFVVGKTADVWVVSSKTRTQWIASGALSDVRAGGPQTVTFNSTSIQSNTFTLDTGTLAAPSAPGDTDISLPYDVVIDFGQDGTFDPGTDLIDGYDDKLAGFYVFRDLVLGSTMQQPAQGPLAVTEIKYSGGAWLDQDTYYPSSIQSMGQLPLVVISHGNGHNYQWYDHLGYHLASYGYVVMSHSNLTGPGSHTAATSTLDNTDFLLDNLTEIGGGALAGHVDSDMIVWIGHSRGGDGVVRAYDQLFRGVYTPVHYAIDDIKLVSSIAPVDFGGWNGSQPILGGNGNGSHPHDATFHLWVGQSDTDVNGCASSDGVQWYHLHDRATHKRQSISLYGVGHGNFHDGGGSPFATGPNLIGTPATHDIMRGYVLPLIKYHLGEDLGARDYLWRQYEVFHPIGAPTGVGVVANLMFQDDKKSGKLILDDFEEFFDPNVASSGAAVSGRVLLLDFTEGKLDDNNSNFNPGPIDPFNGFTYDSTGAFRSESHGCVLSFVEQDFDLTYTLLPNQRDLRDFEFLSFRSAQSTRDVLTAAVLGDLTFSVTLEDGSGNQGTIEIDAYGAGIEEPYQRNAQPQCGNVGVGWTSEFETIRLRLTDFLHNGTGVDLADVHKVIFQFGPSFGSGLGRIGLDEIEFTVE